MNLNPGQIVEKKYESEKLTYHHVKWSSHNFSSIAVFYFSSSNYCEYRPEIQKVKPKDWSKLW